ncbi:MAG: hypothetical protein HY297_01430 [Thaumarchaeota archaeon]|nr:hypothetical protein [Nitrososphaerota archaeon]
MMGFAKKFLVLLLGLGAIGLGLWPLGALAIVYLLLPLRGRRRPTASERTKSLGFPRRFILSAGLAVVGVSALA